MYRSIIHHLPHFSQKIKKLMRRKYRYYSKAAKMFPVKICLVIMIHVTTPLITHVLLQCITTNSHVPTETI